MEYVKTIFRSFEKLVPAETVFVDRLPDEVQAFAAEYPSLANEFYAIQEPCAPPFNVSTVQSIASVWPKRKPKGAVLDSAAAAPAPFCKRQESLMAAFMTMMKMTQGGKQEPMINIYESRNCMKSALDGAPPALADRMNDGVRTVGTTQWSMPPLMPNTDSPVDLESQSTVGGDLIAEKRFPVEDEEVPVGDAMVPIEEPVAKVPVKDAKKTDAHKTTANVLEALLERGADKKKEQALKAAEKRREAKAAAAMLKRPAAATKSGVKKVKHGDDAIPPLGCAKCRYLVKGCAKCRLRRDKVLALHIKK